MNSIKEFMVNLNSTDIAIYSLCFLVLVIILLSIYLLSVYVESEQKEQKQKDFDLSVATKALESMDKKPRQIVMDEYEKNQEETAIISYEELLEQTTKMPLVIEDVIKEQEEYDEEQAPISIKEFNSSHEPKQEQVIEEVKEDLNLTKEMAFLKDLKSFRANMK